MNEAPVSVVIVEDHALTRTGLRTALRDAGVDVTGEASNGIEGLDVIERLKPDVAVIDIGLPGRDGVALTQLVRKQSPQTRVVIVTMIDVETEVLAALRAGADAYVLKTAEPDRIVDAVRIAAEGGAYFDPRIAHFALRQFGPDRNKALHSPLTPRETEIMTLIAQGVQNAEIAERLFIGVGTVKGHIRDILQKLAAHDRTQAAIIALRRGYIE